MSNEHLDRAIVAYNKAYDVPDDWPIRDVDREAFRAGVAELLRDMDQPPPDPPAILGWDLAIKVIKRRAGLEGEG